MAVRTKDAFAAVPGKDAVVQALAEWEGARIAVASLDIDGFKTINDTYGHRPVGDAVLVRVLEALKAVSHEAQQMLVARIAGDEFVVAFRGLGAEQALIAMEGVRKEISSSGCKVGPKKIDVSVSIGVAAWPQHAEDAQELLDLSSQALHQAKVDGRNRVAIYVEDKMVLKSNYYPRAQLAKLASLSKELGRTEASVLREALTDSIDKYGSKH